MYLQSHIYKNIAVSFDFITTWNQEVFCVHPVLLSSWGWAQSCSKHVEDSNKHIMEEIVRQVGYLPELYEDARSEKY